MANALDLVGVAEIAELLGVTRQYVHKLIRQSDEFPPPVATLSAGLIWMREDVAAWAEQNRRIPRPNPRKSSQWKG